MNVSNLELQFSGANGQEPVRVINPDTSGAYWEVYAVEEFKVLMNGDVAIVTNKEHDTVDAEWVLIHLTNFGSYDNVQVFVPDWEGQQFAFFNIDRVDRDEHGFKIILGSWITGA